MLQMVDHKIVEVLDTKEAIDAWMERVQADFGTNFTELDELLLVRKYATPEQLQQVDALTIAKLNASAKAKANVNPNLHYGYASYLGDYWLQELADCHQLPASIRRAALEAMRGTAK